MDYIQGNGNVASTMGQATINIKKEFNTMKGGWKAKCTVMENFIGLRYRHKKLKKQFLKKIGEWWKDKVFKKKNQ